MARLKHSLTELQLWERANVHAARMVVIKGDVEQVPLSNL